jgi:D-alanyl-D-alanine carboxypeptidase (penicillin-binding protein 5/6)
MPTSVDVSTDIRYSYNTYSDTLDAPVEAGQNAGTITVLYGDEIIGSCGLITTSSITRSEFLYRLAQISEFTKTRFFRGTLIAMVVFSILYVIAKAAYRERKLRRVRGEWRRS